MAEIDVDGVHAVREFLRARARPRASPTRCAAPTATLASGEPYRFEAGAGRPARAAQPGARLPAWRRTATRAARLCLAQYAERRQHDRHASRRSACSPRATCPSAAPRSRASTSAGATIRWWSTSGSRSRRWRSAPDAVEAVDGLLDHEAFTLKQPEPRARAGRRLRARQPDRLPPRRRRAAIGFVADHVLALDPRNPQVAARLAQSFGRWRRYDARPPGP